MDNSKIIDIIATPVVEDSPTEAILKKIEELNKNLQTQDGQWIYVEGRGILWEPTRGDRMGRPLVPPTETTPPTVLEDIVKWGNTYDFDNIPKNAVILIKLDVNDPMRVQMMQQVIAKQVLEPRIEILKQNRVCVLFMSAGDDISVMSEEEMSKAGWTKINKSLIINPFDK